MRELFSQNDFGESFTPLVNSAEGDYSIETTFASHTHTNWAFTKPGIYKLEITYTATTKDGKDITSAPQALTVAAGDAAIKDCVSAKGEGGSKDEGGSKGKGGSKDEGGSKGKAPENSSKPDASSKDMKSSKPKLQGLWGLVLPVVLAIVFQGFLNFYNDHRQDITARLNGLFRR